GWAIIAGRLVLDSETSLRDGTARNQVASTHAAPCLRLQAGQRRSRYQGLAGLPRPQEHPAYGALHGTRAYKVQGVLAGLIAFSRFQEQCVSIDPTSRSRPRMESSRSNRQRFVRIGKGRY